MTATAEARDIDLEWVVRNMVGENFDLGSPPTGHEFGEVALSIEDVSVIDASGSGYSVVDHLSLDVRAGEIVCIYGLMGAGRTELLEAVAGRMPMAGGRALLEGEDVSRLSIAQRIARGLVLVPEDRQRDGLVQTMTVGRNLSLASIEAFAKGLFLSRSRERELVEDSIRKVTVKTAGGNAMIGSLSGGNQQKVVIAKWLTTNPEVILPRAERGIDVGAKASLPLAQNVPRKAWRSSSDSRSTRPQHRASDRGDAPGQDFSRVRRQRHQRADHGRLRRSRGRLITRISEPRP